MLAVLLQIALLLFLLVIFQFFVTQFYNLAFRGFAPFIATKQRVVEKIISEIRLQPEAKVFELGAGEANFLRALRKKHPRAELFAVEFAFLPWLMGNIANALAGTGIKFRKENLLKTDLRGADLAYCFLNIKTMERLEGKFAEELKPGAQVVSYQFHLPNKKEERLIDLGKDGKAWVYRY